MTTIKASKFVVDRQTRTSNFSYFKGTWEEVEERTKENFHLAVDGYRDGVILVPVSPVGFMSSLVPITKDLEFTTIYEARREGEKPYKKSVTYGKKQPAEYVDIVLYRKDVLEEDETDREHLTGADWEIVSVNARMTEEPAPIPPQTMARNQLANTEDGKGGSKADYTGDEFAKSIMFWNSHTLVRER